MKKIHHKLCFILLILLNANTWAQSESTTPEPPKVEASSYILVDFHSGKVLAQENPHLQVEPASIT